MRSRGLALVVSGPSGVGKGTVIRHLREVRPELRTSVSHTTRPPREGEVDGRDYIFISKDEFERMVEAGEFLEHAVVHREQSYGTSRKWVQSRLDEGDDVVLEIDYQGAKQIREQIPECVMVFIAPPSWDELVRRLRGRDTESDEEVQKRCESAIPEIEGMCDYEYIVVNEDSEETARVLAGILHAEHFREHRQDCRALQAALLADGRASLGAGAT